MRIVLLFLFLSLAVYGEDWTTTDGKNYQGVTVIKHDALTVTILCKNGGAAIPLDKLSPDIQKRFSFDPQKAAAATKQIEDDRLAEISARQQKRALGDIVNHPMDMMATVVKSASKGGYVVICMGDDSYMPGYNMTIGELRKYDFNHRAFDPNSPLSTREQNDAYLKTVHPLAMSANGGTCILITKKVLNVDQFVKMQVYKAGSYRAPNGDSYAQFTDDPTIALSLAENQ